MLKEKELKLATPEIGRNEYWEQFNKISQFVKENWAALYEGAIRLGVAIEGDCYAPQRISIWAEDRPESRKEVIGQTRLHADKGLKYAVGHKYNDLDAPSERTLVETVKDINMLLDAAKEEIKSSIKIVVK